MGAFGINMVKFGMTRRLEPMDRVRELGDASVPFRFDLHALFFADDAVSVEAELHRVFADRRVNQVNQRREFFYANPAEVLEALRRNVGEVISFTEEPEAEEYWVSIGKRSASF
ncbi:GIY-YIG nuclease family protein [Rhodococcus sp. Eu-32]|uniref:GIY-YIG nuclease family protein n=1 Tax=Rhodococcus sp. Eu-32 TaxID=1017319 RepID=UPI001FB3820A|nr:GIY-YIG nuclease family protein [Rhodococcus sp. Eu-32]